MSNKVTIIGAGSVGATIAYTLVVDSPVSEIVLIDVNREKALGEALDIKQATPFLSPTKVYEGSYEDAEGSDIVVVTSGIGRKPGAVAHRSRADQCRYYQEHCARNRQTRSQCDLCHRR